MSLRILAADGHYFVRKLDGLVCNRCAIILRDVDEIVLRKCIS